jgi:hypothetical protein
MRRLTTSLATILAFALLTPGTALAQQQVNFFLGGFIPRSLDSRPGDDVLVVDSAGPYGLATFNQSTGIDVSEFNGFTFGGEYVVGLGRIFEGELGVGYYAKTVSTSYANFTDQSGNEIQQDLRLRIVPFTATVRWLPLGRRAGFVPYIGGGVGVFTYRYSETGSFLDSTDNSIYTANFVGTGRATGPVVVGGVRFPVGPAVVGGEIKYQNAKGDLSTNDFLAPKIDLTGFNYLVTLGFRF